MRGLFWEFSVQHSHVQINCRFWGPRWCAFWVLFKCEVWAILAKYCFLVQIQSIIETIIIQSLWLSIHANIIWHKCWKMAGQYPPANCQQLLMWLVLIQELINHRLKKGQTICSFPYTYVKAKWLAKSEFCQLYCYEVYYSSRVSGSRAGLVKALLGHQN